MTSVADILAEPKEGQFSDSAKMLDSYMVADIGSTTTTVQLFDAVAGRYRFAGRGSALTTSGHPWFDVSRGVQQAVEQISDATGRNLMTAKGTLMLPAQQSGSGVDKFGWVVSAADPIRTIVVGLLDDFSVASARRVLQTIYAHEVDCFSLSDTRGRQAQVEAILRLVPELILVAGGTDGGADNRVMNLVETLAIGINLLYETERPLVVFAGNRQLYPEINEALGELTNVEFALNVRPRSEVQELEDAVGIISHTYLQNKALSTVPGLSDLSSWSSIPPLPTVHAFGAISEYYAALRNGLVLGLDVGSSSLTIVAANRSAVKLNVRTDLGLGRPIVNAIDRMVESDLANLLEPDVSLADLQKYALNKSLRPQTVPIRTADLKAEQAILGEMVKRAATDAYASWGWSPDTNPIFPKMLMLHGQALTNAPKFGSILLIALDALQPAGVFPVAVDPHGILVAAGLLAIECPQLVVQVLDSGALQSLGSVVAPFGVAKTGEQAIRVKMKKAGAGSLDLGIGVGTLKVVPLALQETAELLLQPAPTLDVGRGPGKARQLTVRGGALGLVIDARGLVRNRHIDAEERRRQMELSIRELGG